jgi:CRISPR-associated exonuclease Cas4
MSSSLRITGVYIQYFFVCHRKLWFFANHIKMEEKSDLVTMGKLIDEYSYKREKKHICIDDTINIDFIGREGTIHEVKKSKSIDKADIYQVKYYIYYLRQRGVENISGIINYPKIREKVKVELTNKDVKEIESVMGKIKRILKTETPPPAVKTKVCKKCAYFELCYI